MKIQEMLNQDTIDQIYKQVIQSQKKYKSNNLSHEELEDQKRKGIEKLMDKNKQVHERRNGAIRNKR